YGRGILHLSILVETMRREGYEFQLGQPQVIIKEIDGVKHEPVESLTVLVPEDFSGKVIDIVTMRKGNFLNMEPKNDRMMLEFSIPSRGIIGLRNTLLTATEGEAIIAHRFDKYEPWKGEISTRVNGALISMETGTAIPYAIWKLVDRGKFFIHTNEDIYAGQVIGENSRAGDLVVNVNKTKKLSNMRASGSDDKVLIPPPIRFSLEEYMETIREDEYLEVTPRSLRLRKILLNEHDRKRQSKI
ncbi:MAG: translational GTPase TypA, partial [Bacteroidales bacterium]|nr:translational GTPase TypA [Bacteroidales bacterium]